MSSAVDKELDRLYKLAKQFSNNILNLTTPEQIWQYLGNNIIEIFGFKDIVVYKLDEEEKVLKHIACFGSSYTLNGCLPENPLDIPLGKGVVGKAAQSRIPILVENTDKFSSYILDRRKAMSELAVPILVDGEVYGVIDSESEMPNFYSNVHLKSLSVIAEMCGAKIAQLNILNKLKQTIEEKEKNSKIQNTLIEISETVYESDSLLDFYESLHKTIKKITFAKNFFVAYLNEDETKIEFSYYIDEKDLMFSNMSYDLSVDKDSITEFSIRKGEPLILSEDEINYMMKTNQIFVRGSVPKAWMSIPFGNEFKKGIVVMQSYQDDFLFSEKDSQILSFVAKHIHNAIERKENCERLNFLALHDSLTRLPNRALFQDNIENSIAKVKSKRVHNLAIFFLDLDLFKEVNDNYGHKVGDAVLINAAKKIKSCLRGSDVLSRLSGDEFAILLEGEIKESTLYRISKNIIDKFDEPILIDGLMIKITVSLGATIFRGGSENAESLMVKAYNSMYQSKLKGRNKFTLNCSESNNLQFPTSRIEYDFLEALQNNDLYCVYQPLVSFSTNSIESTEVLIRWNHKTLGIIPPDQFIPILERSGMIIELDMYVLKNSINQFIKYVDVLPNTFRFNINISPNGFASKKFINYFRTVAKHYPNIINRICVEITEESLISNIDVVKEHIAVLNGMGVKVALDDFGTGYSSLNYLDKFHFDYLKVDKTFVDDLGESKRKQMILTSVIGLAKSLDIKVTVEGIETESQYSMIKSMGCDFGQGYYIAKPDIPESLLGRTYECLIA